MLDWLPGNGKQRVNAKHRICRGAVTADVTAKRQVYRALLPGMVTKGVTTETDVFRRLVDSAVDSETALLEPQKTSVSSHRFPRCFHGIRHFLDWLQAMVTGKVTAEPWFSDWYARPRYATGTHEKAAFAGAEKLSKPDFQNLKKPETQDAAKPNKTLHTLVPQGFVKLSLRSA